MEISKRLALLTLLIVGTMQASIAKEAVMDEPFHSSALLNQAPLAYPKGEIITTITAYSSRVAETDSTPFTTASGKRVRVGVVAANWLPFGTRVKIPEIFGDQIFTVEDRMHERNSDKMDVWFSNTKEAMKFGVKISRVQVL